MTEQEKIIASAYTGYIFVGDFAPVHKYIEKKLKRPVWTHELASEEVQREIHEAVRSDFLKITRGE